MPASEVNRMRSEPHAQSKDPTMKLPTAGDVASQIRSSLKTGGSSGHAPGAQWFLKDRMKSHGGNTAELRREARRVRREITKQYGLEFLVQVADELFSGPVLEEKIAAVFLLEKLDREFGDREFNLFDAWLDRITTWADHDALVHCLVSFMVATKPARARNVFRWAKSRNRWRRRAACVALIRAARAKMLFPEITRLADLLLADDDDMVQKGLGWLLRETAKSDAKRTIPYLMKIRGRAPRLVLRTACERLTPAVRKQILAR
jgi:3-methyladenine DNA glycosylase AlkD